LGRWRMPVAAIFVTYLLLIVGLPFLVLLWSSFQKFYSVPSLDAGLSLTLDPYRFVLAFPSIARATLNSIALAVATATAIMLVTSVVAWVVVRTRPRGLGLLDALASVPVAFPGLVLGLAVMVFYLNVD